jgi:hypothetical protein
MKKKKLKKTDGENKNSKPQAPAEKPGDAAASLGSPVSLGRRISDMTWEKARKLVWKQKY